MKLNREILAFRTHPKPKGVELYKPDLNSEEKVIALFDSCQILESLIYSKGWEYLLNKFGLIKLYQIDKISGWFDTENKKEWMESILYQGLISGFNPQSGSFGKYDEEKGEFVNLDNQIEQVDWEKFKFRSNLLEYED